MDYLKIREIYPEFIFRNYNYKYEKRGLVIDYFYEIKPDLEFKHSVKIKNIKLRRFYSLDHFVLDNLVFNLGIAEMFSYWKVTCSPRINIECGVLDQKQIAWWNKLLIGGMGQYFYENSIDFKSKDFVTIEGSKSKTKNGKKATHEKDRILIPLGGGKDSMVTFELASKLKKDINCLIIKPASTSSLKIAKAKKCTPIITERVLDLPKITELNARGYLNGHIPISSVFHFISILAAYIFDFSEILFSNENSSNEGNINYLGSEINHQYSKTFEFENDFREYNKNYLSDINIFSFLRPLSEIQISKLFSEIDEKYFRLIRSCNVGQKKGIWCGKCPKCLSTYILLLPFIGVEKTISIFGKDLLNDKSLEPLLENLIDKDAVKPFECVGTKEELKMALNLSMRMYAEEDKLPELLKKYKNSRYFDGPYMDKRENEILNAWSKNNLTREYSELLKNEL